MIDLSNFNTASSHYEKQKSPGILNREIKLFERNALSDKSKERFYGELSVLLHAGLDIRTAIELIIDELTNPKEKIIFSDILKAIIAGSNLADAINLSGKFSTYEYYSLQIGEESGRTREILSDLNKYYTKKIKQRRKVRSALSYPVIVMLVAFGAVFFMLRFVVPMFGDMLQRFGSDLPPLTQMIISMSDWIARYGIFCLLLLLATAFFIYLSRNEIWFRKLSARLIMKTPVIGPAVQKIYIERFSHSMQLMLSAKTGLLKALELSSKMIGYYPIESSLKEIQHHITQGRSLHDSLSDFPIYPKRMVSLIRVGEEVNKLDVMFERISQQLVDEIDHDTSVLSSIIEPVMIIFLGIMVATILVAMYLPMFKIGTAFG
ncbi:MAG: type II secretion system F family protein [Bacteroidia bacterium]|nr:type II secretion system F family protein [Bacteroidia bacterium]